LFETQTATLITQVLISIGNYTVRE